MSFTFTEEQIADFQEMTDNNDNSYCYYCASHLLDGGADVEMSSLTKDLFTFSEMHDASTNGISPTESDYRRTLYEKLLKKAKNLMTPTAYDEFRMCF